MIKFLVYIKHHLTFIWRLVEIINSIIIGILYSKKINQLDKEQIKINDQFLSKMLSDNDILKLYEFFKEQPSEYFDFFKPHNFDKKTLLRISKENNYLAYCIYDNDKIVGYCFLRLFFTGKAFTGLITHKDYQGKGLGKIMLKILFDSADILGFKVYSTISKDNIASLRSHAAVRSYVVEKELPNDYLMLKFDKKQ